MTLAVTQLTQLWCNQTANRITEPLDCFNSQPIGTRAKDRRLPGLYSLSLSGAVCWDADADEPCWSVASPELNVCRHAVLSEAAALRWPLSGPFFVFSRVAAGGSGRRRHRDDQLKLEAIHLRRNSLDCRRIRYLMHQYTQTLASVYFNVNPKGSNY